MVEKKRNSIALLVTNCQRALAAKFQFAEVMIQKMGTLLSSVPIGF